MSGIEGVALLPGCRTYSPEDAERMNSMGLARAFPETVAAALVAVAVQGEHLRRSWASESDIDDAEREFFAALDALAEAQTGAA